MNLKKKAMILGFVSYTCWCLCILGIILLLIHKGYFNLLVVSLLLILYGLLKFICVKPIYNLFIEWWFRVLKREGESRK